MVDRRDNYLSLYQSDQCVYNRIIFRRGNMKNSKKYILFLNNSYSAKDNQFYLKNINGKITVAVDGGIRFFRRNKILPDILIGDFDSSPKLSKNYLSKIEVITHPKIKDKTDSQLAVELSLERGAQQLEICGALSNSEIDHTLGNIFLLDLINKYKIKKQANISGYIIDSSKRLLLAKNETVNLRGNPGNYISFIPLGDNCRINFTGLAYPPPPAKKKLFVGDSLTLRNQFKNKRAKIEVSEKILIVAYHED